jgi:hypothetical protein
MASSLHHFHRHRGSLVGSAASLQRESRLDDVSRYGDLLTDLPFLGLANGVPGYLQNCVSEGTLVTRVVPRKAICNTTSTLQGVYIATAIPACNCIGSDRTRDLRPVAPDPAEPILTSTPDRSGSCR